MAVTRDGSTILHADLDAFYASVEQRDHPRLRGRPVVVGTGVVLAASYEARAHGVHAAMNARQARQLCPRAVFVEPRMDAYTEASRRVFEIFADTSPLVEGLSIDEAFLDVTGLRRVAGTGEAIATALRREVLERVGLPITVGVASTKFLAKVASAAGKPDGLLVVAPGAELAFLHPLPVERLWGVGPKTSARLHALGLTTVADVAALPEDALTAILGRASGRHLHALAHNRDPRPVQARRRRSSIGAQQALGRSAAPHTEAEVEAVVAALVDRVARRMRAAHRVGRTVSVRLRFADFTTAGRARTLTHATAHTDTILGAARELVRHEWSRISTDGLTLVGVSVGPLDDADAVQLPLPFDDAGDVVAGSALDAALDGLRDRFGSAAVTRANQLGRRAPVAMPMLPD